MPAPSTGIGDRWLRGAAIDGVTFAQHDAVVIETGKYAGSTGTVLLLMRVEPEPAYIVALADGGANARVRQSELRRAN